jgi:hypothetical protein
MNTQTKLLRECAKRTPIYKPDPIGDMVGAVGLAMLFLLFAFI